MKTFEKGQQVEVMAAWLDRYVPATVVRTFPVGSASVDYVQVKFDANHSIQMIPTRIVRLRGGAVQ